LIVLGGIYCKNKEEMSQNWAYLSENDKKNAIKQLKMAAVLQYTMPGVPCIYYGDENAMEGHIDPFCRRCFDWEHLNEDLIEFYSNLGKIREENREIFKDGDFQEIFADEGFLYYKRIKNNSEIYIYTNNSSKSYLLKLSEKYIDCLTNEIFDEYLTVKPYSYKIFKKL
jgi:glycosidase